MNKRTIAAAVVAVAGFGSVYAMASSLGGVTSAKVGADNVAVAACDTNGVTTAYTTAWDATDEVYEITAVTVTGIDNACDGQTVSISLTNSSGAQIGSGTTSIASDVLVTSQAVTLSTAPSAKLTENVHVLISS